MDAKMVGFVEVPIAVSVAPACARRFAPDWNFTTPGSIVSVDGDCTLMVPVTTYGEFAAVHVVFVVTSPATSSRVTFDAALRAAPADPARVSGIAHQYFRG